MSDPAVQSRLEMGLAHHQAGRFAEAATAYEDVLRSEPQQPDALHLLGLVSYQLGQTDRGVNLIRRAIASCPTASEYPANLAGIYAAGRRFGDAAELMQQAVNLRPDDPQLQARLSKYLTQQGIWLVEHDRPADALPLLQRAVTLKPDGFEAIANIGIALARLKHYEDAIRHYEQALTLKPDLAIVHTNLGAALLPLGRVAEAAAAHRRARELRPDWDVPKRNLAIALGQLNQADEALALFEELLLIDPHDATALFNRGLIRISRGVLPEGWADMEARVRVPEIKGQQTFPQPRWTLNDSRGKTVLLHAEGGLGDTIQFVRYVPEIVARGASVIIQCEQPLAQLLTHNFPNVRVLPRGTKLPAFDVHTPIMSLPYSFGTTLETIPRTVPYLAPPPEFTEKWQHRLGPRDADQAVRAGVVWAGNPVHYNDRQRSIACGLLLPALARVAGVKLFSLQKGPAEGQLDAIKNDINVIDLAPELQDFADTAAVIDQLDVVITVDTSVAHLAGALGSNTWTLLATPPEFRWMRDRTDSPWYPTMRLFRQPSAGDWASVVEAAAAELTRFASEFARV